MEVIQVKPHPIAVVRKTTSYSELHKIIPSLLDEVYRFLSSATVKQDGYNVVLYLDKQPTVEVGVMISGKFDNDGDVVCSSLPGGQALRNVHVGSYSELPNSHIAIHNWAKENGKILKGSNWEIYGDWNDDEAKLLTEVYYLLQDSESIAGLKSQIS